MLGHLYNGSFDPITGKMAQPATMINTKFASPAQQLRWSPDGKKLAYLSNMGRVGPGRNILTIWTPDSGEERFLTPNLRGVNQISWAADSRNIIALGFTEVGTGTYLIDTETSDIKRLNDSCVFPYIGPNGKTVIHWKNAMIQNLNLETGKESGIVKTNSICPACYDLSPDGNEVVFQVKNSIQTISIDGGESREIFKSPANMSMLKWTNDGKNIVIGFMRNKESEVWLIPAKEGTPQKLDISIPKMNYFVLNPDNKRFAYSTMEGFNIEMWVLENFLPK
jgi:Tol biopolymer transport system component